jgi:hypothetical protein
MSLAQLHEAVLSSPVHLGLSFTPLVLTASSLG